MFHAAPVAPPRSTPAAAKASGSSSSHDHDDLFGRFLPCSQPSSSQGTASAAAVKPLTANPTYTHKRPVPAPTSENAFCSFFLSQSQSGQSSQRTAAAAIDNDAKPAAKRPSLAAAAASSGTLEMFGLGLAPASSSTIAAAAAAPAKPKRKLGDIKAELDLSDGE